MRFVVRSSIVLVVFCFNAAAAQEGYFGHDHDKWHRSFYQMLLRPRHQDAVLQPHGLSAHLRKASGRSLRGEGQAWVSVPSSKILKQSAPDLGFHVCAPFKFDGQPDHLYCVVVRPEI